MLSIEYSHPQSDFRKDRLFSLLKHTCDKLQKGIREIFLSFQGGFSKMYRIYRKILNSDEGDFEILVKSGMF